MNSIWSGIKNWWNGKPLPVVEEALKEWHSALIDLDKGNKVIVWISEMNVTEQAWKGSRWNRQVSQETEAWRKAKRKRK